METLANEKNLLFFLINLYHYGYLIVFPVICVIGFFISLVCLVVLINKNFKQKAYFYLKIKTFFETLLLAIGALTPVVSCLECQTYETFISSIYSLVCIIRIFFNRKNVYFIFLFQVIYRYLKTVFFLCATLMEMAVTFDRYYLIQSTSKILVMRNDKILASIFIFLSLLIVAPVLIAQSIETNENGHFRLEETNFGKTKVYSIYLSCITFIQNILTVVVIVPFNVIVLCKYRKFIKKKDITITRIMPVLPQSKNFVNLSQKMDSQKRFTKMILIVSFLFILSRLGEASLRVIDQIYQIDRSEFSLYSIYFVILSIFVEFNTCVIISLNFFIFHSFNKPFRDSFKLRFYFWKKLS